MSNQKDAILKQQTELAYNSVLETLPGGETVLELRTQLGDAKFLAVVGEIWETALDSLYYNVSDETRAKFNDFIEKKDYENLNNYIIELCAIEPSYLILLGKGAQLGAKVIAKENNLQI